MFHLFATFVEQNYQRYISTNSSRTNRYFMMNTEC